MGIVAYRAQCAARFTAAVYTRVMIELTKGDGIAAITLNRPDKLNAFAGTMREDLLAALRNAERDPDCRVVVITGAGRAFSAGGDVESMRELQQRGDVGTFSKLLRAGGEIVMQIVQMPKP